MFAGISRSLIPILTPEYVVKETVKAVLVNQEVLCLPSLVYFILIFKAILPTKSFLWSHKAIGAANTMKSFVGRTSQQKGNNGQQQQEVFLKSGGEKGQESNHHIAIKMTPPDIGINIPDGPNTKVPLNQ